MPLVDLVSLPFWILAALGVALGVNLSSFADETAAAAGRLAVHTRWLRADEWDRTPKAFRWYGWGTACAGLYVTGVLLSVRGLAAVGLLGAVASFVASALPPKRPGRPLHSWGDRLRVWQMAGWSAPFLIGVAGVALATLIGVK